MIPSRSRLTALRFSAVHEVHGYAERHDEQTGPRFERVADIDLSEEPDIDRYEDAAVRGGSPRYGKGVAVSAGGNRSTMTARTLSI